MEGKQTRRSFTKEFKLDVISQSYQTDNIRKLADELGIRPELIYRWRSEYGSDPQRSFPGKGNQQRTPEAEDLARLQRENADLRMERDILKKAIGIFTSRRG